ncbi:MAG TPA: S-layer homology domain-containing protein, partial [Negativicutes bacterium]|nr:S-layer homology domain-containing protein [Negativicutes bacterium]
ADAVQVGTTYPYYTNKITGVFVNGEELDDAQYDLSVGNLIIKDGVAPLGDCTVKITAEGYQDNEISFIVSAKIIGYEVYSDHDGEVYNQLDDDGNIVNQTDDQKFHVTVHFNGEISVTDIAALRNELEIKVNKTFTLVNANDPEADIYATRYGVVAAGADGKSLEFTLHIGFAPMSGHVAITAPNGLTTLKDSQDNPISWQDITFYMPNGVQLQTEEQIAARPEQNIQASVTKKVIAPADATRGMVHMLLLKNGRPVGTVNSFGANITTHYHDYLNLNAEKFAALIEGASSWYSGKFGADYPLTASGEELTITAVNSEEGDVIDLRIFAYPQDRDTQADKTALNVLIAEASSINGSSYTAATYNALQNELYIARSMADSIYYLQSEIDGEREALQTAIDSLQQSSSAPLVPTNLSAAAGNGQITLTWSAATGAASYNVYMGTAAGAYNTTPLATGITSTTYTATSLTNGTAYYFAVTAVNPAGESEKSEEASATPRTSSGGGSGGGSSTTKTSTVTVSSNKSGSATITAASLKTASSVKVTGDVELVLDASALKTIGVEKDLTVSVSKVDNNTLSADLQQKIGNRPVFDIDITSGGKAVTDLGQGELQITIPYTLGPSENAEQIVVYYIDANGQVQEMSGAYYDAEAKAVVFTTNHLSRYAIGYKKSSGFTDVPAGHWAADFISDLVEKGIINGRTETTFAPNDQITRAEFVKILAGIAGIDVTKYTTTSFSDVAATSWFAPYVSWAGQAGVSQGADGKFNPNAPITRQEMAAMIARFVEDVAGATLPLVNEAVTFADDDRIAGYAADAVTMMQKAGIINGKGNNQFAPLDNATRAEAAKMLASLMQILEK